MALTSQQLLCIKYNNCYYMLSTMQLGTNRTTTQPRFLADDIQRAEMERQRAERERQRADTHRQQTEKERQRAKRLAQKLREMGIDPNQL